MGVSYNKLSRRKWQALASMDSLFGCIENEKDKFF
jgi:hypothetical protein